MTKPIIFILLSLFLWLPMPIHSQDDVATILYKEGLKKYILEDFEGAIRDFDSAYRLKPEDSNIKKMYINTLIKQGNIEYEKHNLKLAEELYLKAYLLSGEDEELQKNLIMIQDGIEEEKRIAEEKEVAEKREVEKVKEKIPEEIAVAGEAAEAREVPPERIGVQLPFDIDRFIQQQNEENKKLLSEIVEAQREERETLLQNIEENQKLLDESLKAQRNERETFLKNLIILAQSQSEDRKLFSRSLMMLVGGGVVIAIIIFLGFLMLLRRRVVAPQQTVHYEPPTSLEFKPSALLEFADKIDETKYLTDDRYSEIVRAKRLRELYGEFQKGNLSWDVIESYISELNHEVKSEILSIVENKLKSGERESISSAFEILLPFITDGDTDIGTRSKKIIGEISGDTAEFTETVTFETEETGDTSDPLSVSSLLPMARMVDIKTGRVDHSLRVADTASRIARILNNPQLDPAVIRRVCLAHDIGYLEIADSIMKKEGRLTERQFSIIKTHPERGLTLLKHADLPQIFHDGIKFHHERLDGSGYPDKLEGDEIPLIARVVAVADFFDAVTSSRPHRPALTIDSCFNMMEKLAGKIFDRGIFNILVELHKDQMDDEG